LADSLTVPPDVVPAVLPVVPLVDAVVDAGVVAAAVVLSLLLLLSLPQPAANSPVAARQASRGTVRRSIELKGDSSR
jgi:hypothetical protein